MDVNTSANTCLITYSFTCLSQGSSRKHKGSGLTLKLYFSSICRHRETFNWWKSILLKSIGTLVTQTESTTGSTQIMCFVDEPKTKWTETNFLFYLVHTGNHIQTKKKKKRYNKQKNFRAQGKATGSETSRAEETPHHGLTDAQVMLVRLCRLWQQANSSKSKNTPLLFKSCIPVEIEKY